MIVSIFVLGSVNRVISHLGNLRLSLPKPYISKTVARKPISTIEGRRRSFFNLVNVDGLKARQLVRVERDEDVADQPCLVAGEANRQSRLTILGQNGASS